MVMEGEKSCVKIKAGGPHRSFSTSIESDQSLCFSDAEDHRSRHSPSSPNSDHEIDGAGDELCRRSSCISDCSSFEVDLECGSPEIKVMNTEKYEKDCRICHLSLESKELGVAIVLGCSCKDDLGAAHKQCAETWFKIKGNKTCEVCGSTAKNMVAAGDGDQTIEHPNESSSSTITRAPATETHSFWQGHRFLTFLLACMIFAFVISWLFHFNVQT